MAPYSVPITYNDQPAQRSVVTRNKSAAHSRRPNWQVFLRLSQLAVLTGSPIEAGKGRMLFIDLGLAFNA